MGKITQIKRNKLENLITESLTPGFVTVVYGPRRVGKTTILKKLFENQPGTKFVLGDDLNVQNILQSRSTETISNYLVGTNTFVIDEAQLIENIGQILKLIVDSIPNVNVIASGSASFDLANKVGEPLTGRKRTIMVHPIALTELTDSYGLENQDEMLKRNLLIFGGYPYIFNCSPHQKEVYLKEVINSYLYKDILELATVKNPKKIRQLLTLLAFQIGQEVSLSELGNNLDLSKETVARYLDLLEKSFVIYNLTGFSRNLRKEVTKNSRYYFYDNGILNGLINNFNPTELRADTGALWENLLMTERIKKLEYDQINVNRYFWRTYDQKEIDLIEERSGKLTGYEFKWSKSRISKATEKTWLETYSNSEYQVINGNNYQNFLI